MRPLAFALLLSPLGLLVVLPALADQTFPYKAYVSVDGVYIRSGPGDDYYPTDKLKAGEVVEVYRHDPGGWCAIRPPKGSFTWVSRRYVKPAGEGLGEITASRVAARVGSRFSSIRDVIQVRLDEGEVVEFVERNTASVQDEESQAWVKIAPPSGEFRWIQGKFVDPEYPVAGVRKAPAHESPLFQAARGDRSGQAQRRSAARPPSGDPEAVALPADAVAQSETSPAARRLSPEEFQNRLEEAEIALATMVAEEPTVWRFDKLSGEAETLLTQAETAVQRGRARILADKLECFAELRQRLDAVDTLLARSERQDRRLASLGTRGEGETGLGEDRFDGRGRLTRVVSPKAGAPRYALVDSSGKIRCYVTPAPGMNLGHYEQRWVGVNGTRGYMPEQQAQHIMAQHVSVLEEPVLR